MIGTTLYHTLPFRGIGKYEVIGEDGECILAKCKVCSNRNDPCIVKLNRMEGYKTRWKFVSMVQNCGSDTFEDDDGEHNWEYIWHCDSPFFERFADCKKHIGQEIIEKYQKEIDDLRQRADAKEKKVGEIKLWMHGEPTESQKTPNGNNG